MVRFKGMRRPINKGKPELKKMRLQLETWENVEKFKGQCGVVNRLLQAEELF